MDGQNFTDVIEEHFPYDGPHTPASVVEAARGLSALVRYLNNATGPGNGAASLRYGPTSWRLLGSLTETTYELDQFLDQLSSALSRQADDPSLYDDRGTDYTGADTADEAALRVNAARGDLALPRTQLEAARAEASHLGHDL